VFVPCENNRIHFQQDDSVQASAAKRIETTFGIDHHVTSRDLEFNVKRSGGARVSGARGHMSHLSPPWLERTPSFGAPSLWRPVAILPPDLTLAPPLVKRATAKFKNIVIIRSASLERIKKFL
jgi:hypothetical protein